MKKNPQELLVYARLYKRTAVEREAQIHSFTYGNVHLSNPDTTRKDIERAGEEFEGRKD